MIQMHFRCSADVDALADGSMFQDSCKWAMRVLRALRAECWLSVSVKLRGMHEYVLMYWNGKN